MEMIRPVVPPMISTMRGQYSKLLLEEMDLVVNGSKCSARSLSDKLKSTNLLMFQSQIVKGWYSKSINLHLILKSAKHCDIVYKG